MKTIHTIGHSTRSFQELLAILKSHGVRAIADVRLIPKSRRYPHFHDDFLALELPKAGIDYLPFQSLGGRRHPRKDSPNAGWRTESFRGYADFMQTPAFVEALEELIGAAEARPVATMCAEAVPWRCHRSLISDALLVRGWRVLDIFDERKVVEHSLTPFSRVEGLTLTYPPMDGGIQIMPTHIALLRGVNVGGNILKMQRLRAVWLELGFNNTRTYVQSGNVVFEGDRPSAAAIAKRLAAESRLPITVILRSRAEMAAVVADNPFLTEKGIDLSKLHVTFLEEIPAADAVVKIGKLNSGADKLHVIGKQVYLHCSGGYGRTKLSNNALEKAMSMRATTRNWNTVLKLHEMAAV